MSVILKIADLIKSKVADEDEKGNIVFSEIQSMAKTAPNEDIILDFAEIELVNTAFLNNAIGRIYNTQEYNLKKNNVKLMNMDDTMLDLLKESISLAREKYQ